MRPPRYKLAVINWLAIFPLITFILWVSRPLMVGFPLWTTTLVATLVLVPLMTFLVMPLMLRIFARWLAPRTIASTRPDSP